MSVLGSSGYIDVLARCGSSRSVEFRLFDLFRLGRKPEHPVKIPTPNDSGEEPAETGEDES
tara:strand:+ start:347 stop:529 length:183 start_codon:yes stop_codon:yes gene_type:complete